MQIMDTDLLVCVLGIAAFVFTGAFLAMVIATTVEESPQWEVSQERKNYIAMLKRECVIQDGELVCHNCCNTGMLFGGFGYALCPKCEGKTNPQGTSRLELGKVYGAGDR